MKLGKNGDIRPLEPSFPKLRNCLKYPRVGLTPSSDNLQVWLINPWIQVLDVKALNYFVYVSAHGLEYWGPI